MSLNWDAFGELPGASTSNFERLCRTLIRRQYGQFGEFRALAQQPGVEFHLILHSACDLGAVGRWFGWQCRWYDLPSGRAIGATRKEKIEKAIAKTEEVLPNLTDWVLWTRYALKKADQEWFYSIETEMRLHLWTAEDVEGLLTGQAEVLRSTYFGELVLTPEVLCEQHSIAVAPIRERWMPEVHQVLEAESLIERDLATKAAWAKLALIAKQLHDSETHLQNGAAALPGELHNAVSRMVQAAARARDSVMKAQALLDAGDLDVASTALAELDQPPNDLGVPVRRLRAMRNPLALFASNLIADTRRAVTVLYELRSALTRRTLAVVSHGGYGKTQMAAQLTAETEERPAGVFLLGSHLGAGDGLDKLAQRIVIAGKSVPTFDALAAALDAAGQRAGRRLPIVIDGLNEADDPRDWKGALASAQERLKQYPYVLLVFTLRPDFVSESVPKGTLGLELSGFRQNLQSAIDAYFSHYRIDGSDAAFAWKLLDHPLMLRMFCEVTNPEREKVVGVEAMPTSLTALFERYLSLVADRVYELSPPTSPHLPADVRSALNRIGLALWEGKTRSIEKNEVRKLLHDDQRSWHDSIVRALEHEGILIRHGREGTAGDVAIVYDALAGHVIADAILEHIGSREFQSWLQKEETISAFGIDYEERHPLATDIFDAFVGLLPRRMYRRQLWPLLDEPLKTQALQKAAWLEGDLLDGNTVAALAAMAAEDPKGRSHSFDRLFITRAARSHPLDCRFLDSLLRDMTLADRDLSWTEWLRANEGDVIRDLEWLEARWEEVTPGNAAEKLRARWVMWTLTSTVRVLRDHATRALYRFGCSDPNALFDLTLDSLTVNDPYVPERMLAACYGIAMSLWADRRGDAVRIALPEFANTLVDRMFTPGAPHLTCHVLMRDSALGVITLARRVHPDCIAEDKLRYLVPPFNYVPSPFTKASEITDADVKEADWAIHMDFGNYTIGRLIPNRANYDDKHLTYQEVRRQIEVRIVELGYEASRFQAIDKEIANAQWRPRIGKQPGADRYGKKYAWIAYFEMHGLRQDQGQLDEWRAGERTSDVDIDPSFPEAPRTWMPELPDLFSDSPAEPRAWIANGPTPDYYHLLNPAEVDGQPGPWALLEGYIEQAAPADDRRIFTFLRGVFVENDQVRDLLAAFDARVYPGNAAVPEPAEEYYTYAGEIPWSKRFAVGLRDADGEAQPDRRDAFDYHDGSQWRSGIAVEVPVCRFCWESYHSQLNQVSGTIVPAPALCERLGLVNWQRAWDLYDSSGNVSTMYREFKDEGDTYASHLAFIRCDLLSDYLTDTRQALVWMLWGERSFHHRTLMELRENLSNLFTEDVHIHRRSRLWAP